MSAGKAGAPKGGRVHWLQFELSGEFSLAYHLENNYRYHNYRYSRYRKRTLIDEFIVVRTSKKCYRVTYYNADFKHFQYFSARTCGECADKMRAIYNVFKLLEQAREATDTPENDEESENSDKVE